MRQSGQNKWNNCTGVVHLILQTLTKNRKNMSGSYNYQIYSAKDNINEFETKTIALSIIAAAARTILKLAKVSISPNT